MKHTLVWGGMFNGKTGHDVEMEPPMSGAILLLDRYRKQPITFLKELLAASTRSINGTKIERTDALTFWGSVKYQDAQVAAIALVREGWGEDEVEQEIRCAADHISQVPVNLSQFKTVDGVSKTFSINCKTWHAEPDKSISRMEFELETIEQYEHLQEYLGDEKYNEMLLRRIAMTCTLPEHPDLKLSLAHVMRMPAPVRKSITGEFAKHQLIDLSIHGQCSQCPRKAEGVLNIVDFL